MVMKGLAEAAKQFEKQTGLPPLSKVLEGPRLAEALDKLPTPKQLQTIKEILVVLDRVAQKAPDLDKVVMLMREINSMPIERLQVLEKVLRRIEGILKKAPEELLDFLKKLKEE